MDSIQSVPNSSSYKDVPVATKSSSHSIEVLIHKPHHGSWEERLGGSQPSYLPTHQRNLSLQDFDWEVPHSCPNTKSIETDQVTIQALDRKMDASMNNLFETEDQTKSDSQERLLPSNEGEDERESSEMFVDDTIVSGYKTAPTLKDKKQRAPPPPPLPPRVSLEDLYAKPQKKERRAPPPPPSHDLYQRERTQSKEDEDRVTIQIVKPVVPPRTYLSKSESVDSAQCGRKPTDSLLALHRGNVLNIRAKFESDNSSTSNKSENNVDYILTPEVVDTQTNENKGYLKHEPDVNSNSLTSLQNFYFALQNGTSSNGYHDNSDGPFNTPSLESLLHKSLSQQSVIETYL